MKAESSDIVVVAKGGGLQIVGLIVQRGIAFVFVAVAIRLLTPAGYGMYRQVVQVLIIAGLVAPFGFQWAAVRFIALARATGAHHAVRGTARVAFGGAGITGTLVFLLLLLGGDGIASAFADSPDTRRQMADVIRLGAVYVPLHALTAVLRGCTQGYKTMVPSVIVGNVIEPLAFLVLSTAALVIGLEVPGAVAGLVLSAFAGFTAACWYYRRILTPEERSARPSTDVVSVVRFAIPQAGVNLFSVQSLGLGILIVGAFGTDREVGLLALALSLQTLATVFLSGIVNIWAPMVSELHGSGEKERLAVLYQTVNRWVATFSFPVFAVLLLEPAFLVEILGGPSARAAAGLVVILAVGNIFFVGTGPCGYLISMAGRPGLNLFNSVVAVALYVGLGLWVVPAHGAVGMAVVDATVTAVVNVARVVEARVLVGIHPYGPSFKKPVIATLGAAAVLLIARTLVPGDVLATIARLALAGGVYIVILRIMGLDPEERHVLDRTRSRLTNSLRRAR